MKRVTSLTAGYGQKQSFFIYGSNASARQLCPQECRETLEQTVLSQSGKNRLRVAQMNRGGSVVFFLPESGHVRVWTAGWSPKRPAKRGDRYIRKIVWLAPWWQEVVACGQFLEMDASFRASRPYCYCVPTVMIKNQGFPIGIVIGPTESEDFYESFCEFCAEMAPEDERLAALALLSDEGGALVKIGAHHCKHFFCYRHLLERIGSGSFAGVVMRRLLFSPSERSFREALPQAIADLGYLCRKAFLSRANRHSLPGLRPEGRSQRPGMPGGQKGLSPKSD